MKKSLLALAAMGAFAGAAQAQSSVTVYGILDVGYVGGNERVASNNAVAKQTFSTFNQGAQSTSRLGFRGNEDIGGGTRAFFTIETQLQPQSTTFSSLQTRQAFVGLGQKGIGSFQIGTQNTPIFNAVCATDPGACNNIVGNVIYPSYTGVSTNGGNVNGNTNGFTLRTGNTLRLQTENISGLVANAIFVMNNENDTQGATASATPNGYTGGINNQNGWGLGLNYSIQKLLITANYQSFTSKNPYAATNTQAANGTATTGAPAAWTTGAGGTNVTDNQTYIGAMYDFGILKAYAGWINRKVTSQINSNNYLQRSAQQIGVRANLTKQVEGWASVGNGRYQAFGVGEPTANIVGWQVGSNYNLSKRTNLYAIYGQAGTSSANSSSLGVTSFNASNYAVGVRHTF
ncbi:porin [Polynucleobacter acidiphobus]|uniref:porin n=1 Tax=Polynucleobacter acidiphobus TaxID=556053 RepID=UPI000D34EDDB|nr:porin [Polynucleobacter acidiphobus]